MAESRLDQVVKGAPAPGATLSPSSRPSTAGSAATTPDHEPDDPMASLPSSPPQIYLNLLILEASLRSQYLTLRARRRQHTFFLMILTAWIGYFFYALFMRPREDGKGLGGSVYWVVEMAEKVALMGGVVTAMLIWGTGQWERGVRWPRRWVGIANRGLRNVNSKLIVVKGPWWRELLSAISFLFPYSSLFPAAESSFQYVDHIPETGRRPRHGWDDRETVTVEEDLSPGGDYVKLLLLPKPFSPDFRENWELFRTEYWEKENERRLELRQRLRRKQQEIAKKEGGWLWWTGWQNWRRTKVGTTKGVDGHHHHHHHHHHQHPHSHHHSQHQDRDGKPRQAPRSRSHSRASHSHSHSRTSSRSSTPTVELDERDLRRRSRVLRNT